ncbi:hypothetical protein [Nitrincola sp. MINF-07-Sa-05]|uniref:hypothetical protein n=1 Tax=Nitrincola salilacus TaxID=3400273 RepID=UPI003917C4FF
MAIKRTINQLLRGVQAYYAKRKLHASLKHYDQRMLKDIGLHWERGDLKPINPVTDSPAMTITAAPVSGKNKAVKAEKVISPCKPGGEPLA